MTFFVFVPIIHIFWNRKTPVSNYKDYLTSFDALHFKWIAENGYTHEKNHAFFPGYPMVLGGLNFVADNTGIDVVIFNLSFQILMGAVNCVFLYRLSLKLLMNKFFSPLYDKFDENETEYPTIQEA